MLILETSCANRSFHNEYGNVICAKKLLVEKIYNIFCEKSYLGQLKKIYLKLFFQFEIF